MFVDKHVGSAVDFEVGGHGLRGNPVHCINPWSPWRWCHLGCRVTLKIMQAFEKLVADLLWQQGYWATTAYKVRLTRDEKHAIGRPTTPRWEIDVVAYSSPENEIIAVECKSYLDSIGVRMAHFTGQRDRFAARFKLFNEPETRKVVLRRLAKQIVDEGRCVKRPKVRLGLAVGKFSSQSEADNVAALFRKRRWLLLGPDWLQGHLQNLAESGFEDDMATAVAKVLLRN